MNLKLIGFAALAITFAVLAGAALWYRGEAIEAAGERDRAKTELATAVAVNASQKAAIERLTAFREMDDKLLVELQDKLSALATQTQRTTDAVRDLETTSADVKAYLSSPVPDDLRRVLNNRTLGSGTGSSRR